MKNAFKFVMALLVTILLMLAFRALVFTVYAVNGSGLEPDFIDGDRVLVNRWSYGLRTGGNKLFNYTRWLASPVERGDLVVFNNPSDKSSRIADRSLCACYCEGVPSDTVLVGNKMMVVPGKKTIFKVTKDNVGLICFLYNNYENRKAAVTNGVLTVDGVEKQFATFSNDYYWFVIPYSKDSEKSGLGVLVPENHIIGRVSLLLYSVDITRPFYEMFRSDRWLLLADFLRTSRTKTFDYVVDTGKLEALR